MEVIITMLITAILIGITYTVYSIISKSYSSFNTKNTDIALVLTLDNLLKKDFDRAEIILKDTDGIAIRNSIRTVRYKFNPDNIIRIGAETDTFKIKTDTISAAFETDPVNGKGTLEERNRLDEVNLSLILQNEKITYHYHKVYSSANLFNREPDAINRP